MTAQLSAKAVVCTAHLMLLQNPGAVLRTSEDQLRFIALVRDWCAGFGYYFHPSDGEDDSERTLQ